ncbi:MAG TPA: type IV pilus modification protein PilV [Gammaproteobacteria bacterium]|nr:type IV pilus modification protein PilV [Gammaproteobacteria bacterium]
MNRLHTKPIVRNAGFSMLEAVIALLVLSIGLLGMAGLQSTSTRLSGESLQRSVTTLAAGEIIDKIRMNTARRSRSISEKATLDRQDVVDLYASTAAAASCDPAEAGIANELACWQHSLQSQLPGGEGEIISKGNGFVTVRISWEDRDTGVTESIDWNYMVGTQ